MAKGQFPVEKLQQIETPFYYYDAELLRETLRSINAEAQKHEGFVVHFAVKANANPRVLRIIREEDKKRALQNLSNTIFYKK